MTLDVHFEREENQTVFRTMSQASLAMLVVGNKLRLYDAYGATWLRIEDVMTDIEADGSIINVYVKLA